MKTFISKLMAVIIIMVLGLSSCQKDEPTAPSPTFVGTWKLTKVLVTMNGATLELTPEQAGTQATIIAGADGTYKATTITSEGTLNSTGTYKITGNKLEIKYSDNTTETVEFTINSAGNKLSINRTIEALGSTVPATLEFTKQ